MGAHGGLARDNGGEWAAGDTSRGFLMATASPASGSWQTGGASAGGERGLIAWRERWGSGVFREQQASRRHGEPCVQHSLGGR